MEGESEGGGPETVGVGDGTLHFVRSAHLLPGDRPRVMAFYLKHDMHAACTYTCHSNNLQYLYL